MNVADLVREARRAAGLTQKQLAARLGVTQAAVAQLESPRANPTVATLERTLWALDQQLDLRLRPLERDIDLTLLRDALRLSPAERIAAAARLQRDADALATAGAKARRRSRAT
jgi:transcriptional regulator with XRE-family HTH domain